MLFCVTICKQKAKQQRKKNTSMNKNKQQQRGTAMEQDHEQEHQQDREVLIPLSNGSIMTEWCIKSSAYIRTHVSKQKKHFSELELAALQTKTNGGIGKKRLHKKRAPQEKSVVTVTRTRITIAELLNPMPTILSDQQQEMQN